MLKKKFVAIMAVVTTLSMTALPVCAQEPATKTMTWYDAETWEETSMPAVTIGTSEIGYFEVPTDWIVTDTTPDTKDDGTPIYNIYMQNATDDVELHVWRVLNDSKGIYDIETAANNVQTNLCDFYHGAWNIAEDGQINIDFDERGTYPNMAGRFLWFYVADENGELSEISNSILVDENYVTCFELWSANPKVSYESVGSILKTFRATP